MSSAKITRNLSRLSRRSSMSTATAASTSTGTEQRVSQDGHWMPFTDHRRFNAAPKMFSRASGMYYYDEGGREILDGTSGLWCVNAGHGQKKIVEAVQKQVAEMDFVPSFNLGHRKTSQFAQGILDLLPGKQFSEVFFTMCGSTAVDTALKMALQYWRAKGEGHRFKFIGRERGYHGVGFGGISVGGLSPNRKNFSAQLLPHVDHLPHTHSLKDMAFSRGLPTWGAHLADELERIVALHDPSTIAAVIIEPVAGSTGVLPPPVGYLEKIRAICDKYNILLIFDEVITGFGRVGSSFGAVEFNVTPDMITCAKGLTNAVVPAGAVICRDHIFKTMYEANHRGPEYVIDMSHGYTYSGHPLAMAAGIATLEVYKEQGLFEKAHELGQYFEDCAHALKGLPNVVDVRNYGLMAAVEFAPIPGDPFRRPLDVFDKAFQRGALVRASGMSIAVSPPLILEKKHIDRLFDTLATAIKESA